MSTLPRRPIAGLLDRAESVDAYGHKIKTRPPIGQISVPESSEEKLSEITRKSTSISGKVQLFPGYATTVHETSERDFPEISERLKFLSNLVAIGSQQRFFEFIYRIIYGSQIRLLDDLNGVTGALKGVASKYFDDKKDMIAIPDLKFEDWLSFLSINELILDEGHLIKISQKGKEFLLYMVQRGYPQDKKN